ncbi:hypothetical protein M5X00_29560 [Paenibacillus alvei]|uniref:hypothetical protein n=1 Tax=Paenibacillus alvei TaxID=44250 RepID=UPI00028862BF|nr:hypothetical protein [Paenibacillus alvei]EJW14022.1 hypothetical protein PAV_141p01280 [Paenibacillus alvei DSM 29]MCY9544692.1 hypothetical protein [Paenibacillus alvei]MCY9707625.1 hypothetical protein [Paenibacillus alvei]MCY9758368.1 hypothetical protein [Paenibacillus alvei]MEC0082863.1 hypothetical protein [Paenibacillus alvei]
MNFDRLSSNIIAIIGEVLKNQTLVNYLGWNGDDPSTQKINPALVAPKGSTERIFPYPFDTTFKDDVRTQLHIYYPQLRFENNGNAGKAAILFDIVVHKDIWLLTDNGEKVIRPYQIMKLILNAFKDKQVDGLGEIHFVSGEHTVVNEQFEGFRLVATTTEF